MTTPADRTPRFVVSNDADIDPALAAIREIERAIQNLERSTGTVTVSDAEGRRVYDARPMDYRKTEEVREDLIGAAFAIMQTHVGSARKSLTSSQQRICDVANYWKHRDEWDASWDSGKGMSAKTIEAVRRLGGLPPIQLGQLTLLAKAALGRTFSAESLWAASLDAK